MVQWVGAHSALAESHIVRRCTLSLRKSAARWAHHTFIENWFAKLAIVVAAVVFLSGCVAVGNNNAWNWSIGNSADSGHGSGSVCLSADTPEARGFAAGLLTRAGFSITKNCSRADFSARVTVTENTARFVVAEDGREVYDRSSSIGEDETVKEALERDQPYYKRSLEQLASR